MAALFAVILSLVAVYAGLFAWPLALGAAAGAVALGTRREGVVCGMAATMSICALYGAAVFMQAWPLAVTTLAALWLVCAKSKGGVSLLTSYAWLPAALCAAALALNGYMLAAILVAPVIIAMLPLKRVESPKAARVALVTACMLAGAAIITAGLFGFTRVGRSVYLDGGEWAQLKPAYALQGLNIAASYSYSEFAALVGAAPALIDDLDASVSEAWLVTPTRPLSHPETSRILAWVAAGGRLIAVADHTDLYGHAAVLNGLLRGVSARVESGAIFTGARTEDVVFPGKGLSLMLTPTAVAGSWSWPLATVSGYLEPTYYGRDNFFGPLSPTPDDRWGRWAVLAQKAFGKGTITTLGDSTVLSNFAVFLPGVSGLIEQARRWYPMLPALPLVYMAVLLGVIASALGNRYGLALAAILPAALLISFAGSPLNWGNATTWSGERSAVLPSKDPKNSFSTAYSIAVLSGRKPRWTDDPLPRDVGVWVSNAAPPSTKWRHLSPAQRDGASSAAAPVAYRGLVDAVGGVIPLGWQQQIEPYRADAGRVWTDDVMGNWWFDKGISPARRARFESFLKWHVGNAMPPVTLPTQPAGDRKSMWRLKIAGRDEVVEVEFVQPPVTEEPIFLGEGVSCQVLEGADGNRVIGLSSWQEAWAPPKLWVATPLTDAVSPLTINAGDSK